VAVKLDRFGRSITHLLSVAADLEARGIGLKCLDQPIDTTTPVGRLLFTILAAVAAFERSDLIIERTQAGLVAARARGHYGGRDFEWTPQQKQTALMLRAQSDMTAQQIADTLGVSRRSYYRMISDNPSRAKHPRNREPAPSS
jgi:DNA invertase Pin-like site-specific DNA recombinase